jgi:hypothetical protein
MISEAAWHSLKRAAPAADPEAMSPDLARALHISASAAADAARLEAALAAAATEDRIRSQRQLVQLAASLRPSAGARALRLLEQVALDPATPELELAAYAVAAAAHCDAGRFDRAQQVGASARSRGVSARLLQALGREYEVLFAETGVAALREEAERCLEAADAVEADAALTASAPRSP